MTGFVHLRTHTEYSLVDGILKVKSLAAKCAESGMPAVAVTDQTNLFAAVKFYRAARSAGIKPIIGSDFLLVPDDSGDVPYEFTLLATNEIGYKNIIQLISQAYTEGQEHGRSMVRWEWLEQCADSVICLSGARRGEIGVLLERGNTAEADDQLKKWMSLFDDRYYLELHRTGRVGENQYIQSAVSLAAKHNCPLVATNDVRFLESKDFEAHEARVCINRGDVLADNTRRRDYSDQQFLRSPDEMEALFSDLPEALENTVEIAKRCSVELQLGSYSLPAFPLPKGKTEAGFLREVSHDGLTARLENLFDKSDSDFNETEQAYRQRLDFELNVIEQMGFPGYFLIVMDFIRWAKEKKIPVGPGRGSGAGSLVAYALKITDLDPIAYDLLFERFLNPERVSMPDFDIDFCMDNRDLVIGYVADTYGRDAVSQIVTFGTMAAKAVVRDVARVQGKSYGLADRLSKMIPFEVGMTLDAALKQEEVLRDFLKEDEEAQEIWDLACQLEGVVRNCGKHAGGVVIAPTKLTDFAPLYCDDQGDSLVTQYDKDDVESVGLVKFDFLGLRTLTIIDSAVKMVNKKRALESKTALDIDMIPLEDAATFELLQRAETTAVFQLESRGMKDLIKRQLPSRFEDIVALVALFRPGPLQSGMVDDFINRKHGRAQVAYPHPKYQHEELKPILEPTYGIILYQEQVMQIAQVMGGFSLGAADLLRRAMGKKNAEEMAKQRQLFVDGAVGRGIEEELASNLFDLMEKFAGYGFNKSHSAAYALLAYQTAWLKTHYTAEFMAAVMSSDMQNTDKVVTFVDECHSRKIEVKPPDVNAGQFEFAVNAEGEIIYGLGAIKGLGEGAIESIIECRKEDGKYLNLFDFCSRVDLRKVNKRSLEALVLAGALDSIGPEHPPGQARAIMSVLLPEAVQAAEQQNTNTSAGISDLFGEVVSARPDNDAESIYRVNQKVYPWSNRDVLQKEKDTIGLYLTGHPLDDYAEELYEISGNRISQLKVSRSKQSLGGLVIGMRTLKTKRGDTMCVMTLDDRSGRIDVTLFSDAYNDARDIISKDAIVVVQGQVEHDDYTGALRVRGDSVRTLYQIRSERVRSLRLVVDVSLNGTGDIVKQIKKSMTPYRGGKCSVHLDFRQNGFAGQFQFGEDWCLEPKDELIHDLKQILGTRSVSLTF